jgi:hypothetical protein
MHLVAAMQDWAGRTLKACVTARGAASCSPCRCISCESSPPDIVLQSNPVQASLATGKALDAHFVEIRVSLRQPHGPPRVNDPRADFQAKHRAERVQLLLRRLLVVLDHQNMPFPLEGLDMMRPPPST